MLILARHGESTANAAGLLLGRSDAELTAKGRSQAAALGRRLGHVGPVVSSPLRRALDTAARIDGTSLAVDVRWVEVDYGEYEARPLGEVPAEIWRRWRGDPTYRPADGESLADVSERVAAACEELFAEGGGAARSEPADVVVVSHVSPIKAAVAWALGCDPGLAWRLHLSTGSLTRIGWGHGGPVLHGYNEVP